MSNSTYAWLMSRAAKDDFTTHIFACAISSRCEQVTNELHESLGLEEAALYQLLTIHFPGIFEHWDRGGDLLRYMRRESAVGFLGSEDQKSAKYHSSLEDPPQFDQALLDQEVQEIRDLLNSHRKQEGVETEWLASIVARTSLMPNHLWEDIGVRNRSEITELMQRHFPTLAVLNAGGKMRWKKFLYRQLCERNGLNICRAPNCQECDEYKVCFGTEQGVADMAEGVNWGISVDTLAEGLVKERSAG